eukprot:366045-Chlamydomonas_euryale.AAC.4
MPVEASSSGDGDGGGSSGGRKRGSVESGLSGALSGMAIGACLQVRLRGTGGSQRRLCQRLLSWPVLTTSLPALLWQP